MKLFFDARTKYPKAHSFIINQKLLYDNPLNAIDSERCMYLYLASFRSYYSYSEEGIDYVPLDLAAIHANYNAIRLNRLLEIRKNKLYFKYEVKNNG